MRRLFIDRRGRSVERSEKHRCALLARLAARIRANDSADVYLITQNHRNAPAGLLLFKGIEPTPLKRPLRKVA